jgi:non-canonical (house-cleaning) NTP pyrophosphatase
VVDDVFGTTDVGTGQGAAGVLTDGSIDRESALVHAVAAALAPFLSGAG